MTTFCLPALSVLYASGTAVYSLEHSALRHSFQQEAFPPVENHFAGIVSLAVFARSDAEIATVVYIGHKPMKSFRKMAWEDGITATDPVVNHQGWLCKHCGIDYNHAESFRPTARFFTAISAPRLLAKVSLQIAIFICRSSDKRRFEI